MMAQEIFDRAVRHLLTQRKRSAQPDGERRCLYRGPDGLKCPVGALIPDELYKPEMDVMPIDEVFAFPEIAEFFGQENQELLENLQAIHDDIQPHKWALALRQLALDDFFLDVGVFEEFIKPMQQEIFDRVKTHLLTQGRASLGQKIGATTCMYRGEDGCQCALGPFIPPENYMVDLEGRSGRSLYEDGYLVVFLADSMEPNCTFIEKIQEIHDIYLPEEWARKLQGLATRYELQGA